ncbi:uncharacterized protein LOC129729929 [Wyeomyia smithii]|uniref:uncharacterized protein LOC129729929 n=1 Tax=Wyeomyia smithii TaxID=174621 RepID=UPI00246812C4|nr:uncharacterized protein LOC129729929 [Wyeomyia smithii]
MLIKANAWIYVLQLVVMKVSYHVQGLDSVHIQVPQAVSLGGSAVLICECDLPDEDLYSVKWYKGKHEFFRYTSKEIPSIKIFPKAGISVNVNHSNASHVILSNVEPPTSGKYSCEITEAAPSFHTQIVTRELHVVDLPKSDPVIVDMKPYYGADEFLEVECISNESLPAARLEWLINDQPLGKIQPPSRLEFFTLPANSSASSSSNNNGSFESHSSKKPTKSFLHRKTVPKQPVSEDDDSNALLQQQPPNHEFIVPVAAAIVASAAALQLTASTASTQLATVGSSPTATRKGFTSGRYERSVSRLKLLLGHEHFAGGKIRVTCTARVFDLYERTALQVADENYPQVRVLSNSDNGVHFSFMSDKDDVSSSAASLRRHSLWSTIGSVALSGWLPTGTIGESKIQDTGQIDIVVKLLVLAAITITAASIALLLASSLSHWSCVQPSSSRLDGRTKRAIF